MSSTLIDRYLWLIDLLTRRPGLTRQEIAEYWELSTLSDGRPMPERTFFHMRRGVEKHFNLKVVCNNYNEYSLEESDNFADRSMTNMLLDSYSLRNMMQQHPEVSERVVVENVPSAHPYLNVVIDAISECRKICFSYAGFKRARAEEEINFRPYFLKRYRQRWYMIGLKEKSSELRTYALDRVTAMTVLNTKFTMPKDAQPAQFFSNLIGITYSRAKPHKVVLKADPTQAKYFRALPFHETQSETVADNYSLFSYRLKINYELVHEILGLGASVQVMEPPELVAMVRHELDQMRLPLEKRSQGLG